MEQRLTMITLGVQNLKLSPNFYEEIFEWECPLNSDDNIAFYKLEWMYFSLYPINWLADDAHTNANGSGIKDFTLVNNTNSEQEFYQIINEFRTKGLSMIKEPQIVFWGGYSAYFADPGWIYGK